MSTSGLMISPEMVELNSAYDSDCARVVWDFIRRQSSEGKTVQVVAKDVTFSPAEVANLVGVSRPTIQRSIADGTIKATRHGSRWRVSESEVQRYRLYLADQLAELVADDLDL